jgi:hypothetical protein
MVELEPVAVPAKAANTSVAIIREKQEDAARIPLRRETIGGRPLERILLGLLTYLLSSVSPPRARVPEGLRTKQLVLGR